MTSVGISTRLMPVSCDGTAEELEARMHCALRIVRSLFE
jgi:hypothetical protein